MATSDTKAVAPRNDIKAMIESRADELRTVMQAGRNPASLERFMIVTQAYIAGDPKLMQCSRKSLALCVLDAAKLGLEPGRRCYFVGFFDKEKNSHEATMLVDYRGLTDKLWELARLRVIARPVFKDDQFRITYGTSATVEHVPASEGVKNRDTLIGVWAIVKDESGRVVDDPYYMTKGEIEGVRNRAKSRNSPAWSDANSYVGMAVKTCIRRAANYQPLPPQMVEALGVIDRNEFEQPRDIEPLDDAPTLPPPPPEGRRKIGTPTPPLVPEPEPPTDAEAVLADRGEPSQMRHIVINLPKATKHADELGAAGYSFDNERKVWVANWSGEADDLAHKLDEAGVSVDVQ